MAIYNHAYEFTESVKRKTIFQKRDFMFLCVQVWCVTFLEKAAATPIHYQIRHGTFKGRNEL